MLKTLPVNSQKMLLILFVSSKSSETQTQLLKPLFRLLSHFNTTPDEYSVIFTSGATAALKLIAENFSYGPHGKLVYLQDNHTSVLGMRSYSKKNTCIKFNEAFQILSNKIQITRQNTQAGNSLFVFPAQSNFSGVKYPLSWIETVKNGALGSECVWYVALDAASFAPTEVLDLAKFKPDFVTISFCKIFGYPTGLGALIVKNKSCEVLEKRYYGGGTVFMTQTIGNEVVMRDVIHER